jgi:hypothetical protein
MKNIVGIDNPVVKITTFADALEKGFSQVPTILMNNGVDLKNVDLGKSLASVLSVKKTGAKSDNDLGNVTYGSTKTTASTTQNEAEDPAGAAANKLKSIVAQLQKALSPGGIFGAFKKVPYISSAELAQELVQAPLRAFSTIAKRINAGTKAAEVAPDLKSQVTAAPGTTSNNGNSAPAAPAQPEQQTQPADPSTGPTPTTNPTPTGSNTPKPQGGGANQNYAAAKSKIVPLLASIKKTPGSIDAVIKKLVDAGLDPSKL